MYSIGSTALLLQSNQNYTFHLALPLYLSLMKPKQMENEMNSLILIRLFLHTYILT